VRNSVRHLIAVLVLLAALASAPAAARENSTDLYREGARLARAGRVDESITLFRRVVEISPYYCMGYYGLGKACLYKKGMLDEAIRNLRESVKLDRKLVRGHFYLGMAYFMARRYMESASSFKAAYVYDDTYIEALYNLGVVYEIIEKDYDSTHYYGIYLKAKARVDDDDIRFKPFATP
jgi:tetratricopeptide (TPR) repeat protein